MGEDLYKRTDDKEWRKRIEDRVVSLTHGETVQNDRLDEIEDQISEIQELLEGRSSEKSDNGLKGDIVDLSRGVNKLRAILEPDALGHGGFNKRLEAVETALGVGEQRSSHRWAFVTGVATAIVTSVSLILVNLDHIVPAVKDLVEHVTHAHQAKTPEPQKKGRKKGTRRPRPAAPQAIAPAEGASNGAAQTDVSE